MKKTSKTIVALLTSVVVISLMNSVWGDSHGYEAVGGTISQTNFITVFLVPAVIALSMLGAILLFAYIRIKRK